MAIQELIKIIDEKIENAENDFKKELLFGWERKEENNEVVLCPINRDKEEHLKGKIDAYTDIKILIETSEVLEDE